MISIAERHKYILDQLHKNGFVRIQALAEELEVTTVTIRKDLRYLEKKNLLFITHGSASPANPDIAERNVKVKEKLRSNEKLRIGRAALALLEPTETIILASGSTTLAFAHQIDTGKCQRVITSSLPIATALNQVENLEVIQLGGVLRKNSHSVAGFWAESFFENITCSKLFIGVDGFSLDYGVTNSNIDEARLNKVMMNSSIKTIVLADSTKFQRRGLGRLCSLEQIDILITDSDLPDSIATLIRDQGVELIIV